MFIWVIESNIIIGKIYFSSLNYKFLFREFLVLYRKILIIFIANILPIDYASKATLILFVLAVSFYFQFTLNPLRTEKLNKFEKQTILINLITIYLGIINTTYSNKYFLTFFTAYFFIFSIGFYLFWVYSFLFRSFIHKKIESLKTIIKQFGNVFFLF